MAGFSMSNGFLMMQLALVNPLLIRACPYGSGYPLQVLVPAGLEFMLSTAEVLLSLTQASSIQVTSSDTNTSMLHHAPFFILISTFG